MLKIFTFAFLFAAQSLAMSDFKTLQGDFALSDHMQVTSVRKTETVDVLSVQGSQRLKALMSQGYTCRAQTPLRSVCGKTYPPQELSPAMTVQLQEKWSGLLISLRAASGPATLLRESEGLKIWSVPQKAFARTSKLAEPRAWDYVTYLKSSPVGEPEAWLLYLGNYQDPDSPSLLVVDQETILAQDILEIQNPTETIKYYVDLYISRIQ